MPSWLLKPWRRGHYYPSKSWESKFTDSVTSSNIWTSLSVVARVSEIDIYMIMEFIIVFYETRGLETWCTCYCVARPCNVWRVSWVADSPPWCNISESMVALRAMYCYTEQWIGDTHILPDPGRGHPLWVTVKPARNLYILTNCNLNIWCLSCSQVSDNRVLNFLIWLSFCCCNVIMSFVASV